MPTPTLPNAALSPGSATPPSSPANSGTRTTGLPTLRRAVTGAWLLGATGLAAIGIGGLLALARCAAARRLGPLRGPRWTPPIAPVALVAVAVFGLAGAVLALPVPARAALGDPGGVGADLTAGVVAVVVAGLAAVLGLRRLRVTA